MAVLAFLLRGFFSFFFKLAICARTVVRYAALNLEMLAGVTSVLILLLPQTARYSTGNSAGGCGKSSPFLGRFAYASGRSDSEHTNSVRRQALLSNVNQRAAHNVQRLLEMKTVPLVWLCAKSAASSATNYRCQAAHPTPP